MSWTTPRRPGRQNNSSPDPTFSDVEYSDADTNSTGDEDPIDPWLPSPDDTQKSVLEFKPIPLMETPDGANDALDASGALDANDALRDLTISDQEVEVISPQLPQIPKSVSHTNQAFPTPRILNLMDIDASSVEPEVTKGQRLTSPDQIQNPVKFKTVPFLDTPDSTDYDDEIEASSEIKSSPQPPVQNLLGIEASSLEPDVTSGLRQPSPDQDLAESNKPKSMLLMYKGMKVVPEWVLDDLSDYEAEVQPNPFGEVFEHTHSSPQRRKIQKSVCLLKQGPKIKKSVYLHSERSTVPIFDSRRFMQFQKLQAKLSAAKRFEDIRRGRAVKQTWKFTDEDIKKEMFEVYGEMDVTSERFNLLFQNYKESYLEDLDECEKAESKIICEQIYDKGEELIYHFYVNEDKLDISDEIIDLFTEDEIELYCNLDPRSNASKADWLDLPRPYQKWKTDMLTNLKVSTRKVTRKHVNLAVMDLTSSDFPKYTARNTDHNIGQALCHTLNRLIHEFPLGVTVDVFWNRFYETERYRVDKNSLGLRSVNQIFSEVTDVFYTVNPDEMDTTLLFPPGLRNRIEPVEKIIKRIRHLIFQMVFMTKGTLPIHTLPQVILQRTGNILNFADWGFDSPKELVEAFLKNHTDSDSVSIKMRRVSGDESNPEYYLVTTAPDTSENFESTPLEKASKILVSEPKKIKKKRLIPVGFMRCYNVPQFISHRILEGESRFAITGWVGSPSAFSVVLKSTWNNLEAFQKHIQQPQWFQKGESKYDKEREYNMIPGLVVLVRNKKEWMRGQIIEYKIKEKKYKVRAIDYGLEILAGFEYIRYCPQVLMGLEEAQCVMCTLRLAPRFDRFKGEWPTAYKRIFKALINKGDAFIKFHRKNEILEEDMPIWEVDVDIYGGQNDEEQKGRLLIRDVALEFEKECIKKGLEQGEPIPWKSEPVRPDRGFFP